MRPKERSPCARAAEHDIYAIDCGNVAGRGSFAGFNVGEMRQEAVGGISRDHVRMPWGVARINVFFNLFSIVVPCRSRSSSRRNRRPTSTVPKPASAAAFPHLGRFQVILTRLHTGLEG